MSALEFIRKNSLLVLIVVAGVGLGLLMMDYGDRGSMFVKDYYIQVNGTGYSYPETAALGENGQSYVQSLHNTTSSKMRDMFDKNENGMLDLLEGVTNEANEKEVMKVYTALEKYFPSWVGYNMAKCGGCIRACVSMLEKKGGCMEGRFESPLRREMKAWKMDR